MGREGWILRSSKAEVRNLNFILRVIIINKDQSYESHSNAQLCSAPGIRSLRAAAPLSPCWKLAFPGGAPRGQGFAICHLQLSLADVMCQWQMQLKSLGPQGLLGAVCGGPWRGQSFVAPNVTRVI